MDINKLVGASGKLPQQEKGAILEIINLKVESDMKEVINAINAQNLMFNAKFDMVNTKFDAKFDGVSNKVALFENRLKWMIGIASGIVGLISLVGTLYGIFGG